MGRLDAKVAVIVGGASGFGLATAERFAAEGATVAVVGRRGDLAVEAGARLGGSGHGCDITDFDAVDRTTAEIVARHGRVDVAVNYAGFEQSTPIRDLTPATWQPMIDVQLTGAVWFLRAMANQMADQPQPGGSVISISSLTAHNPAAGQAAYAGAKKALEYITEIAAVEYGLAGVRVNAIAPHLIETPMTADIFKLAFVVEAVRLQTPLGRMGHVDDVANAALFLASDEAGYISGQTIRVDGAASMQKLPTTEEFGLLAKHRPDLLS
ncbi:MAG: SDR family oxidoreductase [Actinomycetota bacterium]